ncbi:chalcone isomerase family protein [Pseudomonas sp.]|uniref:chalcone isomerase family protein n=1 Tax=Pseudomonas sp. TaxID=306 RepID=UPI00272AD259|nr:chalcone isomerase family protein [Pseudomonas sp.]
MHSLLRCFRSTVALPAFFLAILGVGNVHADWQTHLPEAQVLGEGKLTWLGMHIYSARLWGGEPAQLFAQPFALELTYRREISRERLVKTSLDEIRRLQGRSIPDDRLQRWATEMYQAFDDVSPGEQIIGVHLPGAGTQFYINGQPSHRVADAEFSEAFFAIWLDPKTRSPALRQALLGLER